MLPFRVIVLFEDEGQVSAYDVVAEDAHAAMRIVARSSGSLGLIIGAIYGHEAHGLVMPCEDSGKSAYACDLQEDEE